ncbi:MAG: alpha/beta hydrolase [Lachnospiraceae bacterium]|nr:alpha/beta hydrolase [Lachnospiraceae bacterium]
MVRKHGKEPYHIVVLHGGPGAVGSASGLARLISNEFSVLEPMQSKYTIRELEEELMMQIENNCSGTVILVGHSWGAWLAGLFAERFPDKVEKVILIGCAPLEESYVSQIGERRKENMSSEEAEEFERILRQIQEGIGEKRESLQQLGEICDRADGYQEEESLKDKTEINGELYERVWKEAAGLRKSGKLLERFLRISCPLVLIQGMVDPHPLEGVIQPLRDRNVDIKSYVLDQCGHTPWREKYAREEFAKVLFSELEG